MYQFTIEIFNEDTQQFEYPILTIEEGVTFFNKGLGETLIITVANEDQVIACPFSSETGVEADYEYLLSDIELARYAFHMEI